MTDASLHAFEFNRRYVRMMVEPIPEDRMCERPDGLNHPAWQIGHLVTILGYAGTMLGLDTMQEPSWLELFDRGSGVTDERSRYPSRDELLARFDRLHEQLAAGLAQAPAELLSQPTPEPFNMRDFAPTIGDAVRFLMTWHEGAHAGQLAAWRKASGFENVI